MAADAWKRWLLALVSTAIVGLLAQNIPAFVDQSTSSDALLPVSFAWNLFNQGTTIAGFQLPRIPSVVPDMVVIVSLDYLLGGAASATAHLARRATTDLPQVYLPVEHFSTYLLSLLALLLVLRYFDGGRISTAAGLCLTVGVAILSSKKFLADFVFPAIGAAVLLVSIRGLKWKPAAAVGAWIILGTIAGRLADRLLVRQPDLPVSDIGSHVWTFLVEVPAYLHERPAIVLVCLAIPEIIATIAMVMWLRSRYDGHRIVPSATDRAITYAGCFGIIAWWGAVAALALVYVDTGSFRYLAPAVFWPLLLTAAVLARAAKTHLPTISLVQIAAMAVLLCGRFGIAGLKPPLLDWTHPLTACLEGSGLKEGLADYWNSRSPTASSNWRIQIDQITADGSIYVWGNNRRWYDHAFAEPERAPDYSFIVSTRLNSDRLRSRFGDPSSHLRCGSDDVWVYQDDRRLRDVLTLP